MKHRTVYNLLLPALVAFFWALAHPSVSKGGVKPGPTLPAAASAAVSERNSDGSSTGGGSPARQGVSVKRLPMAAQGLGLELVGTVVADDPAMSFAVILNRATGKQWVYREGDRVGEALIKTILRRGVVIDAGTGDEMLSMDAGGNARTLPSTPEMPRLDREEVEPHLADVDQLKGQLLLYPIKEEGEPAGVLIRKIRRGSILWRMGLRNRDVIRGVNGKPISGPNEADAFFRALKAGGEITVEITRAKRPQELRFEIP